MEVVYAGEAAPFAYTKSVFLVGPTPRDRVTLSWRPTMLICLEMAEYDGVVFVPEKRSGAIGDYIDQVQWEKTHLDLADVILAWIPRDLKSMPAFTTNVEFGVYIESGKLIYGRPDRSAKNKYLDWLYKDKVSGKIHDNMISLAREASNRLGRGSLRRGGEKDVPLHIWNSQSFQSWYSRHKSSGNQLNSVKVLWNRTNDDSVYYTLQAKIWVDSDQRHREEYIIHTPQSMV